MLSLLAVISVEKKDSLLVERRKIIQAYGAELVLTPGSEGMKGAIEKAKELGKGKKVLALLPDNGERYLSTSLYDFND